MAGADYRHCDLCGNKAFYDADLDYTFEKPHLVRGECHSLQHLGDWVVLCVDCAKTHKCIIIEDK